jgi:predicted DNA-binding protein (MmcQ/YjbR family)
MDIDAIRKCCLSFHHTTENIQWGYDLVFKVDGKMFAVAPLEVAPVQLSFKCSPEKFAELCELPGIIPAPYMARAQWVALQSLNAIPDAELRALLEESHRLVWERLPKRRREALESATPKKQLGKAAAPTKSKSSAKSAAKGAKAKKGSRR